MHVIPKDIKNTIYHSNMKCRETSKDICLSKICSAFQTAYAHVTVVWSVSGTHKAQEIKAVNKGPTDKGSPDSYESRAGRGLAAGLFRMRADGHEKTNHSDEHLALPFHTDFHLFSFCLSSHHLSPLSFLSHLILLFLWQLLRITLDCRKTVS